MIAGPRGVRVGWNATGRQERRDNALAARLTDGELACDGPVDPAPGGDP